MFVTSCSFAPSKTGVDIGMPSLKFSHKSVNSFWDNFNIDSSVILHTETGTPDVMAELSKIADKVSFPKSRLVKHYGGIGSIENSHGLTVSLLASNGNIEYASKNNHSHMLETDYLDDPKRPGAVLGPKTVPRKTLKSFQEGVIDEEQFYKIHTDLPDFVTKPSSSSNDQASSAI